MNNFLRAAFFLLIVRPVLFVFIGANVRGREKLPKAGPAIVVANHNSHLDTLTIMAMYPLRDLPRLRPVAAMDYFLRTKIKAWFATHIIGIIPLVRSGRDHGESPLAGCEKALDRGDILILFPEGSRGEPERLSEFKRGVAHLVRSRPTTPVYPLFMYGLGKALPKDAVLLVPFNCDIVVGDKIAWSGDMNSFMTALQTQMAELASQIHMAPWE
jgi:1-acyl-sn-glycerol-3-phosphate acyltransferase